MSAINSDSNNINSSPSPNSSNSSLNLNQKANDSHMFLVSVPLVGNENFMQWKFSIQLALGAKRKSGFIDGTSKMPESDGTELDEWIGNDFLVRSWILNSISKEVVGAFIYATTATKLWLELEEHFGESNGPLIYQIQRHIASINQGDESLSKYYTKLKQLWEKLNCLVCLPPCTCASAKATADYNSSTKFMQFLMRLNDVYDNLRNQVLVLDPLPSVHKAYSMALCIEKQREIQTNFAIPTELSAMMVRTNTGALLQIMEYI